IAKSLVNEVLQRELWSLPSSATEDSLGRLPLFPGMKVMIQENIALSRNVVNGAEGILTDIKYRVDDRGRRYAIVVYVRIPGAGKISETLDDDIVPIFPEPVSFKYGVPEDGVVKMRTVSRLQLPILPAYAYTDYKSQGRSLDRAIVDL
ncbi:hypothetical protein FKP32DRAFT_1553246, partial [Trametes sanguinea]